MKTIAGLIVLLALSGCNASYPGDTPFSGTSPGANPYQRGTPEFCDQYGRQTAANDYELNRDSGDSFGSNMGASQRARMRGGAAYERCLAGRTG